jgi:hypothetical protein
VWRWPRPGRNARARPDGLSISRWVLSIHAGFTLFSCPSVWLGKFRFLDDVGVQRVRFSSPSKFQYATLDASGEIATVIGG